MKLNKKISKFLVLGMLTNNIYFNSSANTDVPNRYQTLEGEYITIDNSTVGDLEEIEIFGNTVQDPDNLEDIQSVGDLYVDDDGNPILDRQGREQYKINIITTGKNLFNKDNIEVGGISYVTGENGDSSVDTRTIAYIKIKPSTRYVMSFKGTRDGFIYFYDSNKSFLNRVQVAASGSVKTSPSNAYYARIQYNTSDKTDIQFEEGDSATAYQPYYQSKTTILLPCQLQKVGDVADRLYWDNKKNKYVIEKKIGMLNLSNENHQYKFIHLSGGQNIRIEFDGYNQILQNNGNCILTYPLVFTWDSLGNYENYSLRHDYPTIVLSLDRLGNFEESTIRNYLINNPLYIYNELKSYEYIETNITSKLKIPTYDEKTHLLTKTENNLNPALKVTVDRLSQIAKNAIEEAENDSTSYNISLARMYVNMLPESLYKDQLQEQLSEVFSSDITLDRESASSNLDVYVKSENMLSMSLDTNSITFDGYSGVDAMEMLSAVNISINSSLPYDLNAYIPAEITNADGSSTIDFDILNIKESSESTYQQFADTTNKVVLKSDCAKGNGNIHNIDLKLDSNAAHKADIYKTVIKFEAEQK